GQADDGPARESMGNLGLQRALYHDDAAGRPDSGRDVDAGAGTRSASRSRRQPAVLVAVGARFIRPYDQADDVPGCGAAGDEQTSAAGQGEVAAVRSLATEDAGDAQQQVVAVQVADGAERSRAAGRGKGAVFGALDVGGVQAAGLQLLAVAGGQRQPGQYR